MELLACSRGADALIGEGGDGGQRSLGPERAQLLLKALADPIRLRVIAALADGERCVCELSADLALGQSKLSFHLRVLRDAGLISGRQQGRWIYYRLRPQAIADLQAWLGDLLQSPGRRSARPCA
jgi:ArsR family transcriptional regulator